MAIMNQKKVSSLWRAYPDTFATKLSHGKWVPYQHLQFISKVIAPAIAHGNARIIIEAPPRHGKSELISHWTPTWFLEHWPELSVMLASYESSLAASFGRKVRNQFDTQDILNTKLSEDSKAANRFHTNKGGTMVTSGVGGALTGKGAHLALIDDPIKNRIEALSKHKRETTWEWMDWVLKTRLEPGGSIIILMTRWHHDDLVGRILKSKSLKRWTRLRLPALAGENDPLGRAAGEALCPERYTKEDLLAIKDDLPPQVWEALYQQNPTDEEGALVKRGHFKFYKVLPDLTNMIQSWDMTFKETPDGSFVVGQVWGRNGANKYLVHQIRERMDFQPTLEAVVAMTARFPKAIKKLIEDKANGPAIISMLRNKVSGIVAQPVDGSKYARFEAVSPEFISGNIYVPDPSIAPWVDEYIEEHVSFPHFGSDDQVDATSQALWHYHSQILPDFTKDLIPDTMSGISTIAERGRDSW